MQRSSKRTLCAFLCVSVSPIGSHRFLEVEDQELCERDYWIETVRMVSCLFYYFCAFELFDLSFVQVAVLVATWNNYCSWARVRWILTDSDLLNSLFVWASDLYRLANTGGNSPGLRGLFSSFRLLIISLQFLFSIAFAFQTFIFWCTLPVFLPGYGEFSWAIIPLAIKTLSCSFHHSYCDVYEPCAPW